MAPIFPVLRVFSNSVIFSSYHCDKIGEYYEASIKFGSWVQCWNMFIPQNIRNIQSFQITSSDFTIKEFIFVKKVAMIIQRVGVFPPHRLTLEIKNVPLSIQENLHCGISLTNVNNNTYVTPEPYYSNVKKDYTIYQNLSPEKILIPINEGFKFTSQNVYFTIMYDATLFSTADIEFAVNAAISMYNLNPANYFLNGVYTLQTLVVRFKV